MPVQMLPVQMCVPVRMSEPRQPQKVRATAAQQEGSRAEQQALELLQGAGLVCVARNQRYRCGELDLVLWHGATLVFVEVRRRSAARFGGAGASIGLAKQSRLVHAAQVYLQSHFGNQLPPCRFDVVLLDGSKRPEWLRDVFFV